MAKLGMPSVTISFQEAGIEAVQRSQRGIVALILEEDENIINKLLTEHEYNDEIVAAIENPFTIYTTDDIPSELSEENKDYITKCLLGYVTLPYRIKVYLQEKVRTDKTDAVAGIAVVGKTTVGQTYSGADKWNITLKKMATDRWDYLAIPTIQPNEEETVATWIKSNRENKFKKVKAVLPNYNGDYEGIINFSNTFIQTATKRYTGAEYTARIAGLIAGTPMTISATYAPLSEVINCDKYDLDENDEKVNKGEFFIWFDGTKYKMSRAINSLVTTTQGKLEGYQTIKIVDIMDMIYDDVRTTAQDSYIGKYANTYDNKALLAAAILGYLKELESQQLLQKDYSTVEIDTEAVKNYRLQNGLNTKEELSNMDEQTIKQLDTRKIVFLKATIKILDAMEDIVLPFTI